MINISKFSRFALISSAFVCAFTGLGEIGANAQKKSRVIPLEQLKGILAATKESGWVAFSAQKKSQNIYFSHLQSWRCGMKEIRYSYNSKALDKTFALAKCNPQLPNTIPRDLKWTVKMEKPNSVKTLAVQVTFEDDSKSDLAVYEPCKDVGDEVCTWLLE